MDGCYSSQHRAPSRPSSEAAACGLTHGLVLPLLPCYSCVRAATTAMLQLHEGCCHGMLQLHEGCCYSHATAVCRNSIAALGAAAAGPDNEWEELLGPMTLKPYA